MTRTLPAPAPTVGSRLRDGVRYDLPASLIVFLVALPLSLGIAVASSAPVAAGLIAATVGGIVAGLLGGSPLQVSGPAAGLTVVVAGLVDQFGFAVTCAITVGAGLLQIVLGLSRVARLALAISPTVLHAMLAGIGVTIVLGQLHVLLGGSPHSDAAENLRELPGQVLNLHGPAVAVGLTVVAILVAWKRMPTVARYVPGPLVAVVAVTAVSALIGLDVVKVELGGNLLDSIALPELPSGPWVAVLIGVLTVTIIASVESLLSAVAADKLAAGRQRSDLDRELIGQGAANTLSGLLGGLPVTGVIVRTSTNIAAGARTRVSTVLHGVWMAVFALLLVSLIEQIPMAALAGLLVVIGAGLVKKHDIRQSAQTRQLLVYVITVAGVVLLNLLEGVVIGLVLSAVLVIRRAVWSGIRAERISTDDAGREQWQVSVTGTLSFLAMPALARALARIPDGSDVELDLLVDFLDHTAFEHLQNWRSQFAAAGGSVVVAEVGPAGLAGGHDANAVRSQTLPRRWFAPWSGWNDEAGAAAVVAGAKDYQRHWIGSLRPAMQELAAGQDPEALFLTCADSRIVPNMITSSGPGDLFTVRNVGNLVGDASVLASVHYAIDVLGVRTIVVCGHSGCGAMGALLQERSGAIGDWLQGGDASLAALRGGHPAGDAHDGPEADRLARTNVVVQLDHLRAIELVARAEREGRVELVGMYLDLASASLSMWAPDPQRFEPVG